MDIPAPGENALATLRLGIHLMKQAEYISDHDVKVATKGGGGDLRRQRDAGNAGE